MTDHDLDAVYVITDPTGTPTIASWLFDYGDAPFEIALTRDLTVGYVTLYGSGELVQFNPNTLDVSSISPEIGRVQLAQTARAIAISGDGSEVMVTDSSRKADERLFGEIDSSDLSVSRRAASPVNGRLNNSADGNGVLNYLSSITYSRDEQQVWISATKLNILGSELCKGTEDATMDADNSVRTVIFSFNAPSSALNSRNIWRYGRQIDLDNADSASSVVLSPKGDYFFITTQGTNALTVLDALDLNASGGLGAMIGRFSTGFAPQSVYIDERSRRSRLRIS